MSRTSKRDAEARAREVLASAMAEYEEAHREPREAAADVVLKRLRALHDRATRRNPNDSDMRTARAFANVYDRMNEHGIEFKDQGNDDELRFGKHLIPTMIRSLRLKQEGITDDAKALKTLKDGQSALPKLTAVVDWLKDNESPWIKAADLAKGLDQLKTTIWFWVMLLEHDTETKAVAAKHEHTITLRYLTRLIVVGCEKEPTVPDIVCLAKLALGVDGITEKMVIGVWPKG
jgi:hypothetical protein